MSDLVESSEESTINAGIVDALARRVRGEIERVQQDIESLQTELLRLREQERLLGELRATTLA
jgi:hypothetical protein